MELRGPRVRLEARRLDGNVPVMICSSGHTHEITRMADESRDWWCPECGEELWTATTGYQWGSLKTALKSYRLTRPAMRAETV